jgi:gamma-glutamyl:cysteine ligase YbdK (ATP-grasp superfamily)
MDSVQQRFALVRLARSPDFRILIDLLDELATQAKNEAFSCEESAALRAVHEGRGADQLVTKFKSTIQSITTENA